MEQSRTVDQILNILDEERLQILSGNFARIEHLATTKSTHFEKLLRGRAPSAKSLELLQSKAKRNQQLLAAAVRAIRAVNGRLFALKNQQQPIETYSPDGEKMNIGGNLGTSFERRS